MTVWINPVNGAGAVFDFRDSTLANGHQLTLSASGRQLILNSFSNGIALVNIGAVDALAVGAFSTTSPVWNFVAIKFSGVSGSQPLFYSAQVNPPSFAQQLVTANGITTPICNQISRAFIGNIAGVQTYNSGFSGSLSDLKIYNFEMTLAQVMVRFTAEQSKLKKRIFFKNYNYYFFLAVRATTCSSTSINPQYFYIVLVSLLASFFKLLQ